MKLSEDIHLTDIKNHLRDVFKKLRLPEPECKHGRYQYLTGNSNLGLIFMHHAGCVLSIVQDHMFPLYRHRNLMRPIGSIRIFKNIRMDIRYAGICPVSENDSDEAGNQLAIDGLDVTDIQPDNFCYINARSIKFPYGIPVMFDPMGIEELTETAQILRGIINKDLVCPRFFEEQGRIVDFTPLSHETQDEQDVLFEDLRTKFKAMFNEAACTETTLSTKPRKVQEFWASMIEATKEGRLTSSWMDQKQGSTAALRRVDEISYEYGFALAKHNLLFADCA